MAPEKEDAVRTDLLREIRTAQQSLASQLAELRQTDVLHLRDDMILQGRAKLLQLNALRDQLVGGAKGIPLAALRANIASAVADTRAYTLGISAATLSAQSGSAAQVLSMAEYQRATTDIDRRVAQSYVAENAHVIYANDIARRYGIDISGYDQERSALESERDEARRKGDKLDERKADALIAQNTLNTLNNETDSITDPAARKKHLDEMRDQQRIVDERRAALAAQIELEATRTAAEQHLSPQDTSTYVNQFKKDKLAEFERRAGALKGGDQATAAHAELETALRSGTSDNAPAKQPVGIHPVAAALTPAARAKALEVATTIRATYGTSAGSTDDFGMTSPPPSQIKLATTANAHNTVEVPVAGSSAGASTTLTH